VRRVTVAVDHYRNSLGQLAGLKRQRTTGSHIVDTYNLAGQFDKDLPLYEESLKLKKAKLGGEYPSTARSMAYLGSALLKNQSFAEAETYLRECLTIREKILPDDWRTFRDKSMLGGALAGQKKFQEAEPLLIAGYQGMKHRKAKIPAAGKIRLVEAVERLVQLYEATGKKQAVTKWKTELTQRQAAVTKAAKEMRPVQPSGKPVSPKTQLKAGNRVLVEWNDKWWKGQVLKVLPDGNVKIHYVSWDAKFDEVAPRTRLRLPGKKTSNPKNR